MSTVKGYTTLSCAGLKTSMHTNPAQKWKYIQTCLGTPVNPGETHIFTDTHAHTQQTQSVVLLLKGKHFITSFQGVCDAE